MLFHFSSYSDLLFISLFARCSQGCWCHRGDSDGELGERGVLRPHAAGGIRVLPGTKSHRGPAGAVCHVLRVSEELEIEHTSTNKKSLAE